MTYNATSSIVGYQPIATGWRAVLAAHGAVPDADTILAAYDASCRALHIDPNLALSQACHEATWFTSPRWRTEWNPAGLGITANNTPPNPFKTPQEGIQAHIEHLCCYTYTVGECPCDHGHLADRRHFFHDGLARLQDLERFHVDAHGVKVSDRMWAVPNGWPDTTQDPQDYVRSIVSIANSVPGGVTPPAPAPGGTMRIIVAAGHEHIGSINSDPHGAINPAALRGGTGANGEAQWAAACADALTGLLRAAGVDAVRTDAIYHADVYGPDADLVVVLHYDGGAGTGRAQYCMAATVHSGPSTEEADSRADAFVADWYAIYPARSGIAGNGPITTDMTQEYEGWYRSANSPMVLIEHCLGADAGGIRADRPTPQAGAAWDFAVIAQHFNLGAPQPAPAPTSGRLFPETNRSISGLFRGFWEQFNDDAKSIAIFGYPVTDVVPENPHRCQYFQRWVMRDAGGYIEGDLSGAAAAKAAGHKGPGIP